MESKICPFKAIDGFVLHYQANLCGQPTWCFPQYPHCWVRKRSIQHHDKRQMLHSFADWKLLIASALVTPTSSFVLTFDGSLKDRRKLEDRIPHPVLGVDLGIDKLVSVDVA